MSVTVIDFNDVEPPRPPRQAHYDIDLIVRRLRDTAESWVPRLFPNGRRVGDEWRLANIHGDAPRKSGSCVISLKGPHAGDWHEFDGDQGGGPDQHHQPSHRPRWRGTYCGGGGDCRRGAWCAGEAGTVSSCARLVRQQARCHAGHRPYPVGGAAHRGHAGGALPRGARACGCLPAPTSGSIRT